MPVHAPSGLQALRARIGRLEGAEKRSRKVLPFAVEAIDRHLPEGGLALGALHEAAGGEGGVADGAAAALFVAGIAARTKGPVLWCLASADLFAPALSQAGLAPSRMLFVEAGDEKGVLACFEEGLRHGGLGAVVGEVERLSLTASRRLQLAAEGTGTLAFALRRWRRAGDAALFGQPNAAATRWRVRACPSAPLAVAGLGQARWQLDLLRCRGAESASFHLEAPDGTGRLALPAALAHGPAAADAPRTRAAS